MHQQSQFIAVRRQKQEDLLELGCQLVLLNGEL